MQKRVLRAIPSGGAAVNDLVIQFMNPRLSFRGGTSGIGEYGRFGFELWPFPRVPIWGSYQILGFIAAGGRSEAIDQGSDGGMFGFIRKKLSGSYFVFSVRSRS